MKILLLQFWSWFYLILVDGFILAEKNENASFYYFMFFFSSAFMSSSTSFSYSNWNVQHNQDCDSIHYIYLKWQQEPKTDTPSCLSQLILF